MATKITEKHGCIWLQGSMLLWKDSNCPLDYTAYYQHNQIVRLHCHKNLKYVQISVHSYTQKRNVAMIIHEWDASVYYIGLRTLGLHYRNKLHKEKGNFKIIDYKMWISKKKGG
jgi:hypothetical protein